MSKRTKSWRERLEASKESQVKVLSSAFAGLQPGTLMLVSTPREINEWICDIPFGQTRTMEDLKTELATRHNADAVCPASTAIFIRVIAEAAWEDIQSGYHIQDVSPFWRLIEPDSKIAKRLSFDPDFILTQRIFEAG